MYDRLRSLKDSWGEKAEAMQCYAEWRFYDPTSAWECYVYAVNPEDEDTCMCIIRVNTPFSGEIVEWSLNAIRSLYNEQGEGVVLDHDFRRIRACELFKKLNEGKNGY